MSLLLRLLTVFVVALASSALFAGEAQADAPPEHLAVFSFTELDAKTIEADEAYHLDAWQAPAFEQARAPRTCDELVAAATGELRLALTDAQLDGGPGSRLCLLWDPEWEDHIAIVLNHRSIEDWRATKQLLQPKLAGAGIDPCLVAFWSSVDVATQRAMAAGDRHDAGRPCEPRMIAHGPLSQARLSEVRNALGDSAAWGAAVFGWPLTWPLHVHAYDDHPTFVEGVRRDAGDDDATARSLASTRGVAGVLANGMRGFLLDLSGFKDPTSLRMLIAHEYGHIAQAGAMGCTCNAPFWAIEGGAEYFASLVAGPHETNLANRFASAVGDEFAKRATPLASISRPSASSEPKAALPAYTRGYAAFRFLAASRGDESFGRIHRDHPMGSVDQWLAAFGQVSGLPLDEFDARLSLWLVEQAALLPSPALRPQTRLEPNSQLLQLTTGRVPENDDDEIEAATTFTAADQELAVLLEWRCMSAPISAEILLIAPDGRRYATARGNVGPGCRLPSAFIIGLDEGPNGRTIRSLPGTWRAEVYVDGVLQGTTTFAIQ